MTQPTTKTETIGIDLGDRRSHIYVVDASGGVALETTVSTTRSGFRKWFSARKPCRVVLEASAQSRWTSQLLTDLGYDAIVANPRQLRLIYGQTRKNDQRDAHRLAELGQFKVSLLHPVDHRSDAAQLGLVAIKGRQALVRTRTRLVNAVRAMAKSFGERVPKVHAAGFHTKAREALSQELLDAVGPLLDVLAHVVGKIKAYDVRLRELATEVYPETGVLDQVHGVGPITALTFVLTIDDPKRFRKSRDVAAYLGLVPKQDQSGKTDKELSITKAGDRMLRCLLVPCAQYILGPFGKESDLRTWGLLKAGDGKISKRRAVVAVARKLAVLLHRLWTTAEVYKPIGYAA